MSRGPSDNHASKAKHSAEHVAKTRTTVTVPAKALHYLRILCAVEGRQLQWGVSLAIAEFVQRNWKEVPAPAGTVDPAKSSAKKAPRSKAQTSTAPNAPASRQEPHQAAATPPGLS
jgi:hypothetical protein